mgnify:CR=1 FL=1
MEQDKKMKTEIEGKFLDINKEELRKKLRLLKASLIHKERLMRRINYDYQDSRLEKIGGWIRVRDEGDKITLAYKQLNDRTIHGTKEISIIVNNFEDTCSLLEAIGLKKKAYQETKREKWILNNVEVTIDTWPWVPTFLELEGNNESILKGIAKKLGFKWEEMIHGSVEIVYQNYFDVTEAEVDNWESITFIPIPSWLKKRKIGK